MNWSRHKAGIGYSAGDDFFMNHYLSRQGNVNDIACLNQPSSPWSNIVYKVNEGAEYPKEQINEGKYCVHVGANYHNYNY